MSKSADKGLYRRRGSPNWWVRYADESGRIVRESTNTDQKKLAQKILAKRKTLVAEGRHLDRKMVPKTTFFQLCREYWDLEGRHKRSRGLKGIIENCKEGIGNRPIKDLNRSHIERFLNKRMVPKEEGGPGNSAATRNRYLAYLSSIFNRGIEWGLCVENPTRGIPKLREKGARTRFLDHAEIERLLANASDDLRPILLMALHTGMRRGEIFNLKWQDVDLKNRIITVRESKSGKQRWIPIDDTLRECLGGLTSRFKGELMFPSRHHRKAEKRTNFKRAFANLLENAKISDFRFHDLRHTFASHLVMAGVDLKTVQELLGHQSLAMTMKYSHLAADHRLRAIHTLDRALQSGSDTKTDTVGNATKSTAVSR